MHISIIKRMPKVDGEGFTTALLPQEYLELWGILKYQRVLGSLEGRGQKISKKNLENMGNQRNLSLKFMKI